MPVRYFRLTLMWLAAFVLVVLVSTVTVLTAFKTVGFG